MRIRGWGVTDVGRRRDHNEDSYLCDDALGLYGVADGMGGHLGGERASRLAVDVVQRAIAGVPRPADTQSPHDALELAASCRAALRDAVIEADRVIFESALADPAVAGMGTTLTALFFADRRVHVGHVGDSRAYLYRDGHARQLTDDHTWIQDQVRAGLLSVDEAKESRFRNIITRSVGFEPSVEPDILDLGVQAGDCFLLCSDGLSNHVTNEEIGQVLTTDFYRDGRHEMLNETNRAEVVAKLGAWIKRIIG